MTMQRTISVVIPTFRRDRFLKRCLDALLAQTLDPRVYEVIVVDDDASRKTEAVVRTLAAENPMPHLRYLCTRGRQGPAAARNKGWGAAAGKVIAFTDDDCIPEPDWLEQGQAALAEGIAGVSGKIIVPRSGRPTDYELNTSFLEYAEFATANCFYRKSALEEAGGFDERFTRAWREDADLFFTLLKQKQKLVFSSSAVVVHPVRPGHWGISIREQSKSMFNALLYKKHPDLYRKKIRNTLLPWYYATIAFSVLFILSLAAHRTGLSRAALALWLAGTAMISRKRLKGTSRSPGHVLEMIATSVCIPFLSVWWRLVGAVRFKVFFY